MCWTLRAIRLHQSWKANAVFSEGKESDSLRHVQDVLNARKGKPLCNKIERPISKSIFINDYSVKLWNLLMMRSFSLLSSVKKKSLAKPRMTSKKNPRTVVDVFLTLRRTLEFHLSDAVPL